MRFWALGTVLVAHIASAQPWPLLEVSTAGRARPISILEVQIQELRYGHEGPGYFPVDRAPLRGKQELVEAMLFGQESIVSVRFELVSESGQLLSAVPAFRIGNGADAGQYLLQVEVPPQAFRFRIEGRDSQGQTYASVFKKLFVPLEGSVPKPQLPPGLGLEQSRRLQGLIDAYEAKMLARFAEARNLYPDGAIRIPRWSISEATYEPFVSPPENILGLRVRFVVRFEDSGYYALSPLIFPLYANFRWRGMAGMKVLDAVVDPVPPSAPGSVAEGITEALRLGAAAHYEGNVAYRFTFDSVPDYVIRNAGGTRYCINNASLRVAGRWPIWEEIQASTEPVKYRVDLSNLNFVSETSALWPQKTFYESFLREGAQDCGPTPSIHF
jgi:hypothetical protein